MELEQQRRYYELGKSYWWLAGKYALLRDVLRRAVPTPRPGARVLDLGCGPGNFLDDVAPYGRTFGTDLSPDALAFCRGRGHDRLFRSSFTALPLRSAVFDLVSCVDVLEHLPEERPALAELFRVLRPGGTLLVTLPALQALWGDHDVLYGHYRRYTRGEVRERLSAAGFAVGRVSYYEPLYVAPIWIYRTAKKLLSKGTTLDLRDDFMWLPGPVNAVLRGLLASERFPLRRFDFPLGVSLFALATKPHAAAERS